MSTLRSLTLHGRIQGKIVECKVDDNNLECLAEGKPAFIVHRRWEELEEALPAEEVKHLRSLDYSARVRWALDQYPYLELETYRNANPRGIVGKLLEGVSVDDLRKGERLYRELIAVVQLPGVQACQGRFIRTPAEPSERDMRLRAKETGQVRYWGYNPGSEGQAAIEKLHHAIKVLGGVGKGSILELAVAATPEYNTAFDERLVARIESDEAGAYLYVGYGPTQLYFYI